MNIVELNKEFTQFIINKNENSENRLMEKIKNAVNGFKKENCGSKIYPIPAPMLLDNNGYIELADASKSILKSQHKILKKLIKKYSKSQLLDMFFIDQKLSPFINWRLLENVIPTNARFDIIPKFQGEYQICEFNIDSSIGGVEVFALTNLIDKNLGTSLLKGNCPYTQMGEMFSRYALKHDLTSIALVDWSTWEEANEYFNKSYLIKKLSENCGHLKIKSVNEKNSFNEIDEKTLVYRIFLSEDVIDNINLFKKLHDKTPHIFTTFESEILCHKSWMALLHKEEYQRYLSEQEISVIKKFIPKTILVDKCNVEALAAIKDNYIFKKCSSYGGLGIILGSKKSKNEIKIELQKDLCSWIAQEFVETPEIPSFEDGTLTINNYKIVLGLYLIDNKECGIMVRASRVSEIVNVSNGNAAIGHMIPITELEFEKFKQDIGKII